MDDMTVEQMNEEMERLTGHRYIADFSPLREWLSPDQMKAANPEGGESKAIVFLLLSVAREAHAKGLAQGRSEVAGSK